MSALQSAESKGIDDKENRTIRYKPRKCYFEQLQLGRKTKELVLVDVIRSPGDCAQTGDSSYRTPCTKELVFLSDRARLEM